MASKRRRILREFEIDEISAVDRPAQEGAKMVLMKSAATPPIKQAAKIEPKSELDPVRAFTQAALSARGENPALTHQQAMQAARRAEPALFEKMRTFEPAPAPEPVVKTEVTSFEAIIESIAKRDRCGRFDALKRAAREHPEAAAAYRAA